MSELLVLTDSSMKTCEGNSAKKPAKLRFTFPTIQSLQSNISNDKLGKAIEKLNTVYSELISAVEISEKIKAEEEVRSKMLGDQEEEARLEEEKTVSRMTEVDEVNKRLKNAKIELLKLAGRIGKYKDQFGINVQKGFAQKPPRAISVKKIYTSVYSELMNKIDLYRIAQKDGVAFPQENEEREKEETPNDGIPNWKELFDGNNIQENVTVVVKQAESEEEEEDVVEISSGKLSEEELEYRRMLGQLGDELELVNDYEKNPETIPTQFRDGVKQRANKLRAMLSDLTGIKTREVEETEYEIGNTDFQNLIDKVTGYVAPPTKEEHMKVEESLKEYYSDDNVTTKMRELAEKDILYTFNQGMNQILANEAKQNEQEAIESIDRSNIEVAKVNEKIQERALTDSINKKQINEDAIKALNGYVEMNDKIEQEQVNRTQELKRAAYIIARKLAARNTAIDLNDKNQIVDSSFAEARKLAAKNTAIDLHNLFLMADSSYEQARKLAAMNTAIDINDKYELANSSYEEARKLAAKNTAIDLNELNQIAESSFVEARRLAAQNTALDLISEEKIDKTVDEAYEEALKLAALNTAIDLNELNQISESSSIEALHLAAKNTAIELNEINQILESSYLEALRLAAQNTAIDFYEQEQIAKTASQFAVILASENAKQELLEKREKLSQELNSVDSSIEELNKKIGEYNNVGQESAPQVIEEKPEEQNIIIPMEEIKLSAQEEAQKLFNESKIEQTKIEQPIRVVAKAKPVKPAVQLDNIMMLPISNKYGEQTNDPRPLLATITRVENMQKNRQALLDETETYEPDFSSQNMDYLNDLNEYLNDIINQHETVTPVVEGQENNVVQPVQTSVENPTYDLEAA